jgi:hypothetical protein
VQTTAIALICGRNLVGQLYFQAKLGDNDGIAIAPLESGKQPKEP